jgi:hypothetical protein
VEQGQHLSYRQSIRYHLGMQENLVYGLLMVFEEIFRSPDIHSCYALLRRVHCLHAGSCTCALRSGRPAKTGAITPPRPLYANGRRRFCASRPAHRPPSRLVRAYCVRAIRKPSLADGIAGTPRASQASPSGTDAGARPRVSPDRRDPKTAATEVEHPVRRNCGRADGLRRARPWTPSAAGWRGSATPRCAESPASGIGWDSPGRAPAGMGLALIPTLWLTCRSVRTWRRMRAHSSHAVTVFIQMSWRRVRRTRPAGRFPVPATGRLRPECGPCAGLEMSACPSNGCRCRRMRRGAIWLREARAVDAAGGRPRALLGDGSRSGAQPRGCPLHVFATGSSKLVPYVSLG